MSFPALDRALILDERGYVCSPSVMFDTVVIEMVPSKGKDGRVQRDANGQITTVSKGVKKAAKLPIGVWADAEPGTEPTKARFQKQLARVTKAALQYEIGQGASNIGVSVITAKSGVVVLDIDAGKVPDPHNPKQKMDPDTAHDLLLTNLLLVAGVPMKLIPNALDLFKSFDHVRTPSGGWHYYFRRCDNHKPRSHTGLIKYLDVRAGYQDDDGKWQSQGLAHAPGNDTATGSYTAFTVNEDGNRIECDTLPSVDNLPTLPNAFAALFEKSTPEIRQIAKDKGIAVPAANDRDKSDSKNKMPASKTKRAGPEDTIDQHLHDLVVQFVRGRNTIGGGA